MRRLAIYLTSAWIALESIGVQAEPIESDRYGHHMFDGRWHGAWYGPIGMLIVVGLVLAIAVMIGRWIVRSRNMKRD